MKIRDRIEQEKCFLSLEEIRYMSRVGSDEKEKSEGLIIKRKSLLYIRSQLIKE